MLQPAHWGQLLIALGHPLGSEAKGKSITIDLGCQMGTEQNENKKKGEDTTPAPAPQPAVRKVKVEHLDEPPPSGKRSIHPRRPAPIVPTREERTGEQPEEEQ
jgi:hypothetical protein